MAPYSLYCMHMANSHKHCNPFGQARLRDERQKQMRRKKIIVLTSTFPRWKNDTDPPFVYELSRRLVPQLDIYVLTPNYPGALQDEIMDGMEVHRFRYFYKRFERLAGSAGILPTLKKNKLYYLLIPFFVLAEFWALLRLVRKIKPDVVHAHWLIPQGLVAAMVKKNYRHALCGYSPWG